MILMNVLMLMFACGDKSDDTASFQTIQTLVTGDAYSFEGMGLCISKRRGLSNSLEIVFRVDFTSKTLVRCVSALGAIHTAESMRLSMESLKWRACTQQRWVVKWN